MTMQSLNRKFLDFSFSLPLEFRGLENEMSSWIGKEIQRGRIQVKLEPTFPESKTPTLLPNLDLARQLKAAAMTISQAVDVDQNKLLLDLLTKTDGLVSTNDLSHQEQYLTLIKSAFKGALDQLIEMKTREGKILEEDFLPKIGILEKSIDIIEKKAPSQVEFYRKKLIERLDILKLGVAEEPRILTEVALFADRVDISEEISRFRSHLTQFKELMVSPKQTLGKTLEFLLVELFREINTIGSKSQQIELIQEVLKVKAEIERMREQIQNIE